jgi:trans-aconitate methyltransferase
MEFSAVAEIYRAYKGRCINQMIAADDQMFIPEQESHYFSVGANGLYNVLASLAQSKRQKVENILDLPCGHGRVARHLRGAFPDATISFCDTTSSGVDFCSQTFNGRAIYSRPELTEVTLGGPFDVIWIGSLFTHVDEARTNRWLRYLCAQLSSDGILLATFHGAWAREVQERHYKMIGEKEWSEIVEQASRTGFGYARYPGPDDYGISLSRPSKVIELASAIEGVKILTYTERGWADHHDVLTIARSDRLEPW